MNWYWWQGLSIDDLNKPRTSSNKTNANTTTTTTSSSTSGERVYTLVEVLDKIALPPLAQHDPQAPFSATIFQRHVIPRLEGWVLYARVNSGRLAVGDCVTLMDPVRKARNKTPARHRGSDAWAWEKRKELEKYIDGDGVVIVRVLSIRLGSEQALEEAVAGQAIYGLRVNLVKYDRLRNQVYKNRIEARDVIHNYLKPATSPPANARVYTGTELFEPGRLLVSLGTPWRPAPRARFFTAHCVLHYVEHEVCTSGRYFCFCFLLCFC
jgi:translation elongation factor EF-1alpha